ncbi:4Fe-4S dicluster domain-containing protein (plasmid) [Roseobacteraceae bacterium NS-SX3]
MTLVITSACIDVKDGICTTSCPVDCIYEGGRMFYIHPEECIECGMCESICPVDAIRYGDELGPGEAEFARHNADAFRTGDGSLAEPGGWWRGMAPLTDPEEIAALPPQPVPENRRSA